MPSIVRRTASPPLCATSTEWRATSDERSALPETSSIDAAIDTIDSVAALISLAWLSARFRHVRRGVLRLLGCRIDHECRFVDRRDQLAQVPQ